MTGRGPEQLRADLVRLSHRGLGVREFSLGAARMLSRAVPFEGVCVLTMDPATLLPTSEVVEHGLPPEVFAEMSEIEMNGEDVNSFRALAHSEPHAATLSGATGGDLDRSRRHRELRRPNGFGDELRATLCSDTRTWGALTLLRGADRCHFAPDDAPLIASVAPILAEGLRHAMLLAGPTEPAEPHSPGVAVLAPDNTVVSADAAAEQWLDELPSVVAAVAGRARSIVAGRAEGEQIARARVRSASGEWLLVRASALGEQVAVILEPAPPHEVAPLIADAYGLSEREREVTRLVAHGLPTSEIAARLHISAWTVQDHLKAIFEKVGVGTRGELVARLFFEPQGPGL
jgi:DNA-binding CsgD family transcriptional regulator